MTSGSRMACRTRAAPAPSASSATPTGKPFHTTTLRRVLTNPRMAGLRVHRGEVIGEASWEPVISRGDFERLRGLFSGHRGARGDPGAVAGWGVEKKRRVLRAILEHVTVLPVGRGGRHQAEERLRPRWRV